MSRNPFVVRGMIKSDGDFWGRASETAQIYSWLFDSEQQPQCVAVVGLRRIGKSSLLYRIYKKRAAHEMYADQLEQTECIMLSMQELTDAFPEQFFGRVLDELESATAPASSIAQDIHSQFPSDPEEAFIRFLRWADREDRVLVLILDEFECAACNPRFDKPFFDKLRSLAQRQRLSYLVATQHDLHELWDESLVNSPYSSPFFNIFPTLTLKGFHLSETTEYLKSVSGNVGVAFDEDAIGIVQHVGGNHPYFVNAAAYHVFRASNYGNATEESSIGEISSQIALDPAIYGNFAYYLQDLSPARLQILNAIAEGRFNPVPVDTDPDLAWLQRVGLVDKLPDGSHSLFSRAFTDFVLERSKHALALNGQSAVRGVSQDIATMVAQDESMALEFKSSLRWDYKLERVMAHIEEAILKTVAAFLNTDGGTLIIGANDSNNVLGLDKDYETLEKPNRDGFQLHLINLASSSLGKEFCQYIQIAFENANSKEVCKVTVQPSPVPVYMGKERRLYIRTGNSTQQLNLEEAVRYCRLHWEQQLL